MAGTDCRLPDGKVVFVSKQAKQVVETAPVLLRDLHEVSMNILKSGAILQDLDLKLKMQ